MALRHMALGGSGTQPHGSHHDSDFYSKFENSQHAGILTEFSQAEFCHRVYTHLNSTKGNMLCGGKENKSTVQMIFFISSENVFGCVQSDNYNSSHNIPPL